MKKITTVRPVSSGKKISASFDPSMPSWLRRDVQARYGSIRNKFAKSYDLANAKFSDFPVDSNWIPIYLIDGTSYIPGVNDNDTVMINGRQRTLGKIAKSRLDELADDVVYMDLESAQKSEKEKYRDPRRDYRKGDSKQGDYAGQTYHPGWKSYSGEEHPGRWSTLPKRDKSGYEIPDPTKMLKDYYSKPGNIGKLSNKVADIYERIVDTRNELLSLDFSDFKNIGNESSSTAYGNALNRLGDAIRDYSMMYQKLPYVLKALNPDGSYNSDYDTYFLRGSLQDLLHDIKVIKSRLDDIDKYLADPSSARY